MTTFSNYSQRAFSVFAALAVSAVLFAQTLAVQAADLQSAAGLLA